MPAFFIALDLMATQIFISYRRKDTETQSQQIADRLKESFGESNVFFDSDSIPLGVDFVDKIQLALAKSDAVLVVIGEQWLASLNERLSDDSDFVRLEVELALKREIPVIPLLIGDTRMPSESELPPSIRSLARRNGQRIRLGSLFKHEIVDLSKRISQSTYGTGQTVFGDGSEDEISKHHIETSAELTFHIEKENWTIARQTLARLKPQIQEQNKSLRLRHSIENDDSTRRRRATVIRLPSEFLVELMFGSALQSSLPTGSMQLERVLSREIDNPNYSVVAVTKWLSAVLICLIVTLNMTLQLPNDQILAASSLAFGLVWVVAMWSSHRLRRSIVHSQDAFRHILKPRGDLDFNQAYSNLVSPIFGHVDEGGNRFERFWRSVFANRKRLAFITVCATCLTFGVARNSLFAIGNASSWFAYVLLLFMTFCNLSYLITIVIGYHQFLNRLRSNDALIQFSFNQAPNLTIRHLAPLGRQMSFPLVVLYVVLSIALYITPILSNIVLWAIAFICMLFPYYSYAQSALLATRFIRGYRQQLLDSFRNSLKGAGESDVINAEMESFLESLSVSAEPLACLNQANRPLQQ